MVTPVRLPPDETRERVRELLEDELRRVDSPEAAERIVNRLEQLAGRETEAEQGEAAARREQPAAVAVEQAAEGATRRRDEVAAVLHTVAAEAVAPTPEAPVVLEAAQEALGTRGMAPPAAARPAKPPPEVRRGRELLREAALHRMRPWQALDARLFLVVNRLPHPRWADRTANLTTVLTAGGALWVALLLLAILLRVPRSKRAVVQLLPSLVGATWVVEYPVKALFRRRRPFIDIVRALVVGKKPGSWSFPSGHTAASFATAWVLSTIWRRSSPLFFAMSSGVGFSRIYVGAHYPGDVVSGAYLGVVLAELIRRLARWLFSR